MNSFDPKAYGPVFAPLVAVDRRRALGTGEPDAAVRAALEKVSVESAFGRVADAEMAACCVSGVWLLHDFLDESHTISQSIETPSGSFWHGIMHRREGDFGNAKYWFRRVGEHPVIDAIGMQLSSESWDPFEFVDVCQALSRGKSDASEMCLDIQQLEWELLFDYCFRSAVMP